MSKLLLALLTVIVVSGCGSNHDQDSPAPLQPSYSSYPYTETPSTPVVYYDNCDQVRRAGKAPISKGQPGYRPELDRDRNGVACEQG